ncbi:hypothetical protein ASG63_07795 [Methylobacterium sp. Leaf94]|jgi:hypothetical protein|uniref:hypothetical protein n=1 Tax=Methylobacterium sp. Leaf94 TaxID=1736250 RepID=UPI0006FE4EEB|nr:hypothetical protein [Methylobacterium sp. Leaf94]KQU19042.1 hypothetical protein ASG63_07795 [Methylobacterium sp. Leaf94]
MAHELTEPVHWRGRQWAVTGYGIEALDGMYHVSAAEIWSGPDGTLPWLEALHRRYGTDREDLDAALKVARTIWSAPDALPPLGHDTGPRGARGIDR